MNLKCTDCLNSKFAFYIAAENGHYECVLQAYEKKYSIDVWACMAAAKKGHLKILKFLYSKNFPWYEDTPYYAAKYGQYKCLKFAIKHRCPLNKETIIIAAKNGEFECLQLLYTELHENKCLWDATVFAAGVQSGKINILKFLYNIKCPLDATACIEATNNEYYECIKFLHEIKCPCKHLEENILNLEEDEICIICYSRQTRVKYEPCNHKICCNLCHEQLIKIKSNCPKCRSIIKNVV